VIERAAQLARGSAELGRGSVELVGRGWGLGAGAFAAAMRVPQGVVGSPHRADPDIGRLGPLTFDSARRIRASDGGELFTSAHGHGPSFLFVHGLAMTSRIWTKQFRMLPPAGIRTVAFDHRGHGASTAPLIEGSIERLADDVHTVMAQLDLRDVVLVGHSTGGMAVLAYALQHSQEAAARVRGMVLISTAARIECAGLPFVNGAVAPFTAGFVRSGTWSRGDWSTMAARSMFGRDPLPSQVELVRVLLASASEDAIVEGARAVSAFNVSSRLSEITVPALVVGGTADLLTTPREARRLARGLASARLELIGGAGHMVPLERADRLGALLSGFARELGVAAGLAA
jgi:pimeloyl-ACP methyl ester carboxylesterase